MLVVAAAVVAARVHRQEISQDAHHLSLLTCHCRVDKLMIRLPFSAPADVVVGVEVVEGAALMVVAAVVTVRVHRQEISQDAHHFSLLTCHLCIDKLMSRLPVSAPVGAEVDDGAALVIAAAVVAA